MTPAELRRAADEADAAAVTAEREAAKMSAAMRDQAVRLRALADELEAKGIGARHTLTATVNTVKVNVNKPVTDEHRFNIAKGQKRGDKFLQAITKADFTQKTLAEKLDIAPALLSMYRQGKRPIPRERAEEIERLTGWKATARNWPGNIVS